METIKIKYHTNEIDKITEIDIYKNIQINQ